MNVKVTESHFKKVGGRWVRISQRTHSVPEEKARDYVANGPLPFEKSHRVYKQTKGPHKVDTYESIRGDGQARFTCFVDFAGLAKAKKKSKKK